MYVENGECPSLPFKSSGQGEGEGKFEVWVYQSFLIIISIIHNLIN